MLSASCSIETPVFTRRTLDWLSTSLLKGISRDGLSLIFETALVMSDSPRRAAERLSLELSPVTNRPARLSLSDAQHQLKAKTACGVTRPPRCPQRGNRSRAAERRAGNRRPSVAAPGRA